MTPEEHITNSRYKATTGRDPVDLDSLKAQVFPEGSKGLILIATINTIDKEKSAANVATSIVGPQEMTTGEVAKVIEALEESLKRMQFLFKMKMIESLIKGGEEDAL